MFVGNQHRAAELPQAWWTQAFRQSVIDIGRTVLVLQPWHAPVPLTRSWCLWEIFSTLDGGAELHIALSPAERKAFQYALVRLARYLASRPRALTLRHRMSALMTLHAP